MDYHRNFRHSKLLKQQMILIRNQSLKKQMVKHLHRMKNKQKPHRIPYYLFKTVCLLGILQLRKERVEINNGPCYKEWRVQKIGEVGE